MANTHSLDLESGSSQYADIVSVAGNLNPTGTFTVECWMKLESVGSMMVAVTNVVTDANTYGPLFQLRVTTSGKLEGNTWNAGSSFLNITGATTLSTATWYHTAFVKTTDSDWKIYLDAVQDGSSVSSRTLSTTGKTGLRIGANEGGSSTSNPSTGYFDGLIDEVRLWNTARTQVEISNNKSVELVGNESGLVAYYKLNNNYSDTTANGYNLTAANSPVFSTDVPFVGAATVTPYGSGMLLRGV